MSGRLVITGMGAVTPIGTGVDTYWRNLLAGKSGICEISQFDASNLPVRVAAAVPDFDSAALPRSVARNSSRFLQLAFLAGTQALEQAGIDIAADPVRIGLSMGTALAGADEFVKSGEAWTKSSTGRISPHLLTSAIHNMGVTRLSIHYGIKGPGLALGTACSAGADAVISAAYLILSGEVDAMLVTGGESAIAPPIISSLAQAKALSRRNDSAASRPFDIHRDGFVVGEGGGAILLESEENATRRGAKILGVLSGWGRTLDAHHVTAPDPAGEMAAECMRQALRMAKMEPGEIGYINAHGTGTQLGDLAEARAIRQAFGSAAVPVSSTKGATGHLMGAGGLTELITCLLAMQESCIPHTINVDQVDPEISLDLVTGGPRQHKIRNAASNSLGFGGQNTCLIVSRA